MSDYNLDEILPEKGQSSHAQEERKAIQQYHGEVDNEANQQSPQQNQGTSPSSEQVERVGAENSSDARGGNNQGSVPSGTPGSQQTTQGSAGRSPQPPTQSGGQNQTASGESVSASGGDNRSGQNVQQAGSQQTDQRDAGTQSDSGGDGNRPPEGSAEGNPMKPGDHQPDRDDGEMVFEEFDWKAINRVGDKGRDNIIEYLRNETPHESIEDLVRASFDYKQLPKVGKSKAQSIRQKANEEVNVEQGNLDYSDEDLEAHEAYDEQESRKLVEKFKKAAALCEQRGTEFDRDLIDREEAKQLSPEGIVGRIEEAQGVHDYSDESQDSAEDAGGGESEQIEEYVWEEEDYKRKAKMVYDRHQQKYPNEEFPRDLNFSESDLENKSTEDLADYAHSIVGMNEAEDSSKASGQAEDTPQNNEDIKPEKSNASGSGNSQPQSPQQPTIVLINTVPLKGSDFVQLEDILEEEGLYQEVEDHFETAYWDSPSYNDGAKQLATLVRERIHLFKGKTIYVDDRRPGNRRILPYLMSAADFVVKATV